MAALQVPLLASTVLGLAIWINRLLGHQNLGGVAITLTAIGAMVLHLALTRMRSPRFTAVAASCGLALAGAQVGVSTNPDHAMVPAFVLFGAAAGVAGQAHGSKALQWTRRLGRAAFSVSVLAIFAGLGVLALYLWVTASGASWGSLESRTG